MSIAATSLADVQLPIENVDPDRVRRIVDHVERVMEVRFEEPIGVEIRAMLESLVVAILATEPTCTCLTFSIVDEMTPTGPQVVQRMHVVPGCPIHGRPLT